jgi:hypothetical protein
MLDYIHNANIDLYRRLIAESERNPKRDEDRNKMLQTLLAEEIAKDKRPRSVSRLSAPSKLSDET